MKIILLTLTFLTFTVSAQAKEIVVAISPHFSKDASKNMLTEMAKLYGSLALGDKLTFINSDASAIATLSVPNNEAYRHRTPRLKLGAKELAKLNAFLQSMTQGRRTLGAIDAPFVLSQIVRNYPNATDIVLIGSALYDNPRQPGVNMASMRIPSDGFITARPTESPFGTKGREKHLQGKRIHWLLPHASGDTLQNEALLRFWHLYLHHMGASLITFTHNSNAVMQLLLANAQPLPMNYKLDTGGKMTMQSIRKLAPELSLYSQPVSQNPLPPHVFNTRQTLSVGIEWQGQGQGVDLDVYAKPKDGKALFYGHNASEFGKHYKDVLSGHKSADNRHYETIEFHTPIDVRTLVIAVNVYSANEGSPPINGTLRLQLAGRTYAKPFVFKVSRGNAGADIETLLSGSPDTAHSKRLTVMDIIGAAEVTP